MKKLKILCKYVMSLMLVFMLASASSCKKLPRTIGFDIADYQDNPVIFNVWVNDQPFVMSNMRGRSTTMGYPAYSKLDSRIHIKLEWVEVITNKSFVFETKVNPEDLLTIDKEGRVSILDITAGRNGEITISTIKKNSPDQPREIIIIEQHCLPLVDQGDAVFERIRKHDNGYEVLGISDSQIENAINAIQYVEPHVSSCE